MFITITINLNYIYYIVYILYVLGYTYMFSSYSRTDFN